MGDGRLQTRRCGGFTLVEMILAVVVLGILTSFAVIRFQDHSGQYLTLETDQLRRNVSHMQMLAITRAQRLRLSANGGSYTIEVCDNATCLNPAAMTDPATGRPFVVTLQHGARIASSTGQPLYLDSLGRPVTASGLASADPAARLQLTLGNRTTRVDVAPLTGFARAVY